jgi:hypothetical protein
MRSLLLSALAATTIVTATSVGLATDASAATRHVRQSTVTVPVVTQDPYRSYNSYGVTTFDGRRDVNPISGTPRWNGLGSAP